MREFFFTSPLLNFAFRGKKKLAMYQVGFNVVVGGAAFLYLQHQKRKAVEASGSWLSADEASNALTEMRERLVAELRQNLASDKVLGSTRGGLFSNN